MYMHISDNLELFAMSWTPNLPVQFHEIRSPVLPQIE